VLEDAVMARRLPAAPGKPRRSRPPPGGGRAPRTQVSAAEGPPFGPRPSGPGRAFLRVNPDLAIAVGIFAALLALYSANGEVLPGHDATPNVYLAAAILDEGRLGFTPSRLPRLFTWELATASGPRRLRLLDLSEDVNGRDAASLYAEGLLVPHPPYFLTRSNRLAPAHLSTRFDRVAVEDVYVGVFGPGAGLSAVPVLAPLRLVAGPLASSPEILWLGAKFAASLYTALSASLVFLAARRWLARRPALLLALAYGAATSVFSTSSQSLWQHGPNAFFLSLGIYGLARERTRATWAGAAFGAATLCRPTSALFAVAAAGWLLFSERRALGAFLAGALPLALSLAAYNAYYLGSPWAFGQLAVAPALALAKTGSPAVWQTPLLTGLAGLLASPSRGLLVFSPWLFLGFAGSVAAFGRSGFEPLRPVALASAMIMVLQAKFFDWWGGWAYGCRPLVDLAPALALLAVPVAGLALATRRRAAALALLTAWSLVVQLVGALTYDVEGWNARRVERIWWPSGEVTVVDGADAPAASARGGQALEESMLDVDRKDHRDRLWSLADNQIGYYLSHAVPSFRSKAAGARAWVESFRRPRRR